MGGGSSDGGRGIPASRANAATVVGEIDGVVEEELVVEGVVEVRTACERMREVMVLSSTSRRGDTEE